MKILNSLFGVHINCLYMQDYLKAFFIFQQPNNISVNFIAENFNWARDFLYLLCFV